MLYVRKLQKVLFFTAVSSILIISMQDWMQKNEMRNIADSRRLVKSMARMWLLLNLSTYTSCVLQRLSVWVWIFLMFIIWYTFPHLLYSKTICKRLVVPVVTIKKILQDVLSTIKHMITYQQFVSHRTKISIS